MGFGLNFGKIVRYRVWLGYGVESLGRKLRKRWTWKNRNRLIPSRRKNNLEFYCGHRGLLQIGWIISRGGSRDEFQSDGVEYRIRGWKKKSTDWFLEAWDGILILARIVVIGTIFAGLAIAYVLTRCTDVHVFPAILRRGVEFLGPIFIKFGQWASTRNDLFSEEIREGLMHLQRNVAPHSWIYTKSLLESAYGSDWRKFFVKFESKRPIGSGCCAQVYKAWIDLDAGMGAMCTSQVDAFMEKYLRLASLLLLKERIFGNADAADSDADIEIDIDADPDGGSDSDSNANKTYGGERHSRKLQPVAVKVLHPGIKGHLRRDLFIMRGICRWATYLVPRLHWLSLTDCIDEFSRIMNNQVDMNLEAANLTRFSKNFSSRHDVVFPRPYMRFTRRDILVESFHEGLPISDYLDCNNAPLQRKLAKMGIAMILKMVFKDNFIHCDLHPGNILVQNGHESKGKLFDPLWRLFDRNYVPCSPCLIVLDCGLVVSLNERCRGNLRDVFRSVSMGNGELAAEYILEHNSEVTSDSEGFKMTMKDIVDSHLRRKVNPSNVSVSTVVNELFSAMVRHRVKQDGSFGNVILSMAVIESIGRSLDPNIDILAEALPFVFTSVLYRY